MANVIDHSNTCKLGEEYLTIGSREANMEAYDSLPADIRAVIREAPADYDCLEIAKALRRMSPFVVKARLLRQNVRIGRAIANEYANMSLLDPAKPGDVSNMTHRS